MLARAVLAALLMGVSVRGVWGAAPRDLVTVVTDLGHMAGGLSAVTSPDCSRLALVTHAGYLSAEDRENYDEKWAHGQDPIRMVVDGKATVATDQLTVPTFSADSKHVGYAIKCRDKWHVVEDEKVLVGDADNIPGDQGQGSPIVFSPDSQHVATIVEKDYRWHVAVDGKEWPVISMPTCGLMSFSPDSQHVVVVGRTKNSMVIYEDGAPMPLPPQEAGGGGGNAKALARIYPIYVWEPDSSGVGYYGAFPDKHWQVFTTEAVPFVSKQYDGILPGSPQFSPDSKRLVYVAKEKGKGDGGGVKWVVMTDGDDVGSSPLEDLYGLSVKFLAPEKERENPRLIYLARRTSVWNLYVNHQAVGEGFDAVLDNAFTVSPDKKHFAFLVLRGGHVVLVRDGKAIGNHDSVAQGTLAFSQDSQHLAYGVREKGRWRVCVDEKVGAADFANLNVSPIAFSPDSKRVAFTAELNHGISRLYVGMDGEYQSKFYEAFLRGCAVNWRDNSSLVTIAVTKMVAYRVEAKVPDGEGNP